MWKKGSERSIVADAVSDKPPDSPTTAMLQVDACAAEAKKSPNDREMFVIIGVSKLIGGLAVI